MDYTCPVAEHGEMEVVQRFTGTHFTGDEKYYRVAYCPKCGIYHFVVSMEAAVSSGVNYFSFRVELTADEAREMLAVMAEESDPDRIEQYLERFDQNSVDRRAIIEDEYERWVSSDQ